jgi:hypothetical protein
MSLTKLSLAGYNHIIPRNDVAPLKTITYRAIKTTGTLIVIMYGERMSLPEYIAAIGEEPPAQELVCDDNLTKYHWDSPTLSIVQLRFMYMYNCVKRYSVSGFSVSSSSLKDFIQGR